MSLLDFFKIQKKKLEITLNFFQKMFIGINSIHITYLYVCIA